MPSSIGINLRVTGHCSQGGRKYMEDFFSVAYQQSEDEKDLEYAFFGIYDGHGGSEAATFAKENLMNEIVSQKLFWSDLDQDVLRAIREGYIATHYAMWKEQEKWPRTSTGLPSTAGTTASVAFIRRGKIYIGHVGDSGIVLGYQEDGEKYWRAKALTHDHKPECNVEKTRILNSGGKVVTKSGVPRVVWNRPRIGHRGPVRRSTPIDEIPFLAVARSLGDLWSYNSALNEFVVSPDPDVKVIKIDPKNFRCLIFGTDGLWNVLSPTEAVEHAFEAELVNEHIALGDSHVEWTNPSKVLVDKALEQWSIRRMRADNTSVVTIMLDPPGPPKKDVIRNCSSASYGLEYTHTSTYNSMQVDSLVNSYGIDDSESETLYESSHDRGSDSDQLIVDSFPTNGYAVMTRFDDYESDSNGSDRISSCSASSSCSDVNSIVNSPSFNNQYMNSFAESYNSLLISNFEKGSETDEADVECYKDMGNNMLVETDNSEHSNQYQLHQYQQQCMAAGEGYSLTKLETRGEQQFNSMRNCNHRENLSFQDFGEAADYNQYNNISSSYQQLLMPSENVTVEMKEVNELYCEGKKFLECKDKDYCEVSSIIDNDRGKSEMNRYSHSSLDFDESIQINEISSSMAESNAQHLAALLSDRNDETLPKKVKNTHILNNIVPAVEQNENELIYEPRRLRSSILPTVGYNKRMLRSRNTLRKNLKNKTRVARSQQKRSTISKVLKTSNNTPVLTHPSTNHSSLVWSQRQRKKSSKALSLSPTVQSAMKNNTLNGEVLKNTIEVKQSLACRHCSKGKPKANSKLSKRMDNTSRTAVSTIINNYSHFVESSQPTAANPPSSSRNSAWCYSAVQTRNRVQKRSNQ